MNNLVAPEDETKKFIARIQEHVPLRSRDSTVLILKAHLVSEEIMNDLISSMLPHPEHIQKSRLNYAQILNLAKSVSDDERHDKWVWAGLKKLNEIRNSYSHSLEPKEIETKENELVTLVETHTSKKAEQGYTNLAYAVLCLLASLLLICEGIKGHVRKNAT